VSGQLRICGTPIGNLGDLTPRVREALAAASVVACEDTRRTGALLEAAGVAGARLVRLDDHTEQRVAPDLVERIAGGETICLVTDAGMPAVSDPGRRLVDAVLQRGLAVEVLPGPSAVTSAVAVSGIPADRFAFLGFLPRQARALSALIDEADGWGVALVAFEAPHRLPATLRLLADRDASRPMAVCRELTKLHEEVVRGTAREVAAHFREPPHGEITLVLAAHVSEHAAADGDVDAALAALRAGGMPPGDAAALLARLTGRPRRDVYRRGLHRE
jgi:16S rRNA (cytidine1402-2'-O)-methyltransferase